MTRACIQPCFRNLGNEPDYYNGREICPGSIIERDVGLCLYNNHLCLSWKSQGVNFSQDL